VCPAKIDLGNQIYKWRQDLDSLGKASPAKRIMSAGMKFLFAHPSLFKTGLSLAPIINSMPRFMLYNSLNDWGKGRELPEFAKESFTEMWKKGKVQGRTTTNIKEDE
jgi:L-lactate dehydrogenase complex protein LldF